MVAALHNDKTVSPKKLNEIREQKKKRKNVDIIGHLNKELILVVTVLVKHRLPFPNFLGFFFDSHMCSVDNITQKLTSVC